MSGFRHAFRAVLSRWLRLGAQSERQHGFGCGSPPRDAAEHQETVPGYYVAAWTPPAAPKPPCNSRRRWPARRTAHRCSHPSRA
jgi:hypothetical protein